MNEAEEQYFRPTIGSSGDLLTQRLALRKVLAERVDSKQMTGAEAELEFAKNGSANVAEEQRRNLANRSIAAQEQAVFNAAMPVTCTRSGAMSTCY